MASGRLCRRSGFRPAGDRPGGPPDGAGRCRTVFFAAFGTIYPIDVEDAPGWPKPPRGSRRSPSAPGSRRRSAPISPPWRGARCMSPTGPTRTRSCNCSDPGRQHDEQSPRDRPPAPRRRPPAPRDSRQPAGAALRPAAQAGPGRGDDRRVRRGAGAGSLVAAGHAALLHRRRRRPGPGRPARAAPRQPRWAAGRGRRARCQGAAVAVARGPHPLARGEAGGAGHRPADQPGRRADRAAHRRRAHPGPGRHPGRRTDRDA